MTITVTDDNSVVLNTQDAQTIGELTDSAGPVNFASAFVASATSFGADGMGSDSWSYGLTLLAASGADSGLDSNGSNVYLYKVGDVIVGSTAASGVGLTPSSSSVVFTLSVNGGGGVTLNQMQEIDHAGPGVASGYGNQEAILGSGLVGLTGTVVRTDGDGDTATDSKTLDLGGNVTFDDDGPSVTITVTDDNSVVLNTQDAQTIGELTDSAGPVNFASAFVASATSFGADGMGSDSWSYGLTLLAASGADSGLDSNGSNVYLYKVGDVIVGSTAASGVGLTPSSSSVVFTLSVNG
ncbi:DUF5801 repeats-in-toxin domain-containing protein, partial [Aeromonas hydrophila]